MKRTKALKFLTTLTLALVLCLSTAVTAFAAGGPITGTEDEPAAAGISKILEMNEGTTTPNTTFTFKVKSTSVDGQLGTATNMPVIADQTISFTSTDDPAPVGGKKIVQKETANIFAGVTWPHAGVYTYTITEVQNSYTELTGEDMEYSQGEYEVSVYVENKADGSGFYIAAIGALIITPGSPGQAGDDKVDPTPGGDPDIEGDFSKMTFTNVFEKTKGGTDPEDPEDVSFSISKTVTGAYAEMDKFFEFNMTLTQAATLPTSPAMTYKAYVLDADGDVVTSTDHAASALLAQDAALKTYIKVTAGVPVIFKLQHDQTLVVTEALVGTKYAVTETGVADYTPSVDVVVDGSTAQTTNAAAGASLQAKFGGNALILVGEDDNSADFTNAYKTVTPTGIGLNDLPFIMMLVLAAGALVTFVAVRYRKRAQASKN